MTKMVHSPGRTGRIGHLKAPVSRSSRRLSAEETSARIRVASAPPSPRHRPPVRKIGDLTVRVLRSREADPLFRQILHEGGCGRDNGKSAARRGPLQSVSRALKPLISDAHGRGLFRRILLDGSCRVLPGVLQTPPLPNRDPNRQERACLGSLRIVPTGFKTRNTLCPEEG